MRKPKSKAKRMADLKRGAKRNKRFKESRKTVAKRREAKIEARRQEKKKFLELLKKIQEARAKGEL